MIWNKFELTEGKTYGWAIKGCKIWVQKHPDNWSVSTEYPENKEEYWIAKESDEENNKEWKKYIVKNPKYLYFLPVMPDLPVVLKPKNSIKILPKQGYKFYINIPVWIQLYHNQKSEETLLDQFPVVPLSNTWFGEPDSGELAYSYNHDFFDFQGLATPDPAEALCPVQIINQSPKTLDFQRLLIRMENLSIYRHQDRLIASQTHIEYKGQDQINRISFIRDHSFENLKLLSNPRNPEKGNILNKSFDFIKNLYPY